MILRTLAALACLVSLTGTAASQDFYDDQVLRPVTLDFHDANWWQLLKNNWPGGPNILADMTVDGIPFPSVGVHIKGNSSFFFLPPGSKKVSLGIDVDEVTPGQNVYGHRTLNLNNGIEDPTFCREVTYQNIVAKYSPNGRGAFTHLTINGNDWGLYVNIEQYSNDLLKDFFEDEDGLRFKCPNNPNGPGLSYLGATYGPYKNQYELRNWMGHPDPWKVLVDACDTLDNESLNNIDIIDAEFAIDAALWTIALENLFMDEDSYISKGADFQAFYDPYHQRMHLNQHDGNESFGVSFFGWPNNTLWELPPLHNKTDPEKPVLFRLLDVPEIQQRYFAHLRTLLEQDFRYDLMGPRFDQYKAMIDATVQADPKKIYSYQEFLDNFTQNVTIPDGNGGNMIAPGLSLFVQNRRTYLTTHNKINKPAPVVADVEHSPAKPNPGDPVTVRATVTGPSAAVGLVQLHYRSIGRFIPTPMFDDGAHGDGAAGDGVYGVLLPIGGTPGERVQYYVGAASASGAKAMTFSPRKTEHDPLDVVFGWGSSGLKITEYMYSGSDGEWFELTNTSAAPIDLSGWSMDDQTGVAGTLDLSAAGVVAAGQSIVVSQADPAVFSAAWGLAGTVVIGPNLVAPLGRNDQINIYDAGGLLVERLTFGDEDFPGSPRAKDAGASPCLDAVGADDAYGWILATAGDGMGSTASSGGDLGNPGVFQPQACSGLGTPYCATNPNSTGAAAVLSGEGSPLIVDNDVTLSVTGLPVGQPGYFLMSDSAAFVAGFGGSQGNLCLGSPILRFNGDVLVVDGQGQVSFSPDLNNLPQGTVLQAGERWNFQLWYRDLNPANTSNTSNGLTIDFL
jgi:CotH kinase protein/Lamin Tail Domain